MTRLFSEFNGMIRIYHNDTPCPHLIKPMANLGFDVFNFSHETDIAKVQGDAKHCLMGNVSPRRDGEWHAARSRRVGA